MGALRAEHYGWLRGDADPDLKLDALRHLGIHWAVELLEVEEGSRAEGENPTTPDLRRANAVVTLAVVRNGKALYEPDPQFYFRAGDPAVPVGEEADLKNAAALFRAPPPT